jgi:putative transposase
MFMTSKRYTEEFKIEAVKQVTDRGKLANVAANLLDRNFNPGEPRGGQYGSADCLASMRENNLEPSMSRRGNCHDNAVAESFFSTFKKRVIQRKIHATREQAKSEIFNFIEMFYNPIKRHTGGVSPAKFEEAYFVRLEGV